MSVEHGRSPQWKTIFLSHLDSVSPLASSHKTKLSSHSRKRYLTHTIDDFSCSQETQNKDNDILRVGMTSF